MAAFLPRVAQIEPDQFTVTADRGQLTWYEAGLAADITLMFDLQKGIPDQLQRRFRVDGSTLLITYRNWNVTVEITAPS